MQPGQLEPIMIFAEPTPLTSMLGPIQLERLHAFPEESRMTYDWSVIVPLPAFWRESVRLVLLLK